jgi:outer membrane lipoprotein SlyB
VSPRRDDFNRSRFGHRFAQREDQQREADAILAKIRREAEEHRKKIAKDAREWDKRIQKAGEVARDAIRNALAAAERNIDTIVEQFRLDAQQASAFRQGAETGIGALRGASQGAVIGRMLGPQAALAGGLLGAIAGALGGRSLEDVRQQLLRVKAEADRATAQMQRQFFEAEQRIERLKSMRRHTGRLG